MMTVGNCKQLKPIIHLTETWNQTQIITRFFSQDNIRTTWCSDGKRVKSFKIFVSTSLSFARNSGLLAWIGHSSWKRSAVHFYKYVQYFHVSKQSYGCQCLGFLNVHTDVDACDCTRGLCGHRKRICIGSWPWEKYTLPHRELEPASVLRLVFQSVCVCVF